MKHYQLRKSVVIYTVTIMLFIISPVLAQSQSLDKGRGHLPPKVIRFDHLTTKDGLTDPTALRVIQDDQGFIWITTANGLNKYDGYRLITYLPNPDDPASISHEIVTAALSDNQGVLWFGTWGGGLNRYNPETGEFIHYRHDPENPNSLTSNTLTTKALLEDSKGNLWISSMSNGGLMRFDREKDKFIRYRHDPDNPHSIGSNEVSCLYEDSRGILWIGTENGVDRFNREEDRFIHYRQMSGDPKSLSGSAIFTMMEYDGKLWAGSLNGDGISVYDYEKDHFVRHYKHDPNNPQSISNDNIATMYKDSHGTLWIATQGGGLNVYDPAKDGFVHYKNDPSNPHSLSHNNVYDIFEDRSGVLWFATFGGGISIYDRKTERFGWMTHVAANPNSLSSPNVQAVYEDLRGYLWIGTADGLNRYDPQSEKYTHYTSASGDPANRLSNNDVKGIAEDKAGSLWIATSSGLNRFDPQTEKFTAYRNDPTNPDSMLENICWAIHYCSRFNEIWLAQQTGVTRYDITEKRFSQYPRVGEYNTSIYEDSHHTLWLFGAEGIWKHDRKRDKWTVVAAPAAQTCYEDRSGNLWVATTKGLALFDRKKETFTERYTMEDGLIGNYITAIVEDDDGGLWCSTTKGISLFHNIEKRFRNYNITIFNTGAALKNKQGELFFGARNGLVHFYPEHIVDNPFIPPVVLTAFKKFNKKVKLDTPVTRLGELSLAHDDSVISFEFAALDFSAPLKNLYQYMLKGFDRAWTKVGGAQRFATYTNLDEGMYVFKVKGANNDGIWNEAGAQINISIAPDPEITPRMFRLSDLTGREITLPYNKNSLSIEIAPLDYSLLGQARTYMLKGYDTEPINAENKRFVHYSRLNPGRYTFKTTGYITSQFPIIITPPFWKTWWFYSFIVLLIAGWVAFIYAQQISRLKAQNQAKLLAKEMELARQIQTAILPRDVQHDDLEIESTMITADEVGGDFYDILYSKEGPLWLAIGDVSGHGVTPGLIMMMAQTVHTTITTHFTLSPREVVILLNEILCRNVQERLGKDHFMTFTTLKYQGTGTFEHAGAHLSMGVYRRQTQTCELIRTPGTFLNFVEDISESTVNSSFTLEIGDILVLYSDGLTEATNPDDELLDIHRFQDIVKTHAGKETAALRDAIIQDVLNWCENKRADDISLVVVRRMK